MKNTCLILITLTLFMSCSQNDDLSSAFNLENQLYLAYKNIEGQNLLVNSTPGSYNLDNMKLIYLIENEPIEVTLENGFNMGSLELTPENNLKVFTNPSSANVVEESADYQVVENIAYLQLSHTERDTIKTYAHKSENYYKISQVWYNSKLVWTGESDGVIEIIK